MKQELTNTINLLAANPFNAIAVQYIGLSGNYQKFYFPAADGKTILNANKELLEKQYGSVPGFFEYLLKNSITELKIADRKKNGSTYVATGKEYATTLIKNDNLEVAQTVLFETPKPAVATPAVAPQPQMPAMQPNYGMNGGMNGADFHKVYDHDRIQRELIKAETKVETLTEEKKNLEAKIISLEKDIFRTETLGLKKEGQVDNYQRFLETILNSPVAPILAEKFAPATTVATGLAGASPSHDNFGKWLQTQSQDFVNDLSTIAGMMVNNPEFDTQLIALVTKYQTV